jgi:hypothetical protein
MLRQGVDGVRNMMARLSRPVAALVVAGSIAMLGASGAGAADPQARQILAPTGTLKVGLYPGTPTSILLRYHGMEFVEKFTRDAKSEGLVRAAIALAGLRGAMTTESIA